MTLTNYKLVSETSIDNLNQVVTDLLRNGWQISGSPIVCVSPINQNASSINNVEKLIYYQALVKS